MWGNEKPGEKEYEKKRSKSARNHGQTKVRIAGKAQGDGRKTKSPSSGGKGNVDDFRAPNTSENRRARTRRGRKTSQSAGRTAGPAGGVNMLV